MKYAVKEIFFTLQGEGAQTGRAAVFCRFTGCNLWTGLEKDRADALCRFCDTDFVGTDGPGGGFFQNTESLAAAIDGCWISSTPSADRKLVVCTGGEPLLQLTENLIAALHGHGFEVAIETNGTRPVPAGVDWICVSPKARAGLIVGRGDEIKLVYPQDALDPEDFARLAFTHFFLQPMDGPERERNTTRAIRYCMDHPQWRLSLQTHKLTGLP